MRQTKEEASCFGGIDHCPLSQGFMALFESAPDQLPGDGLFGALQLHETLGQKTHAPALFALRRLRAGQSDQMRLLLSIELLISRAHRRSWYRARRLGGEHLRPRRP